MHIIHIHKLTCRALSEDGTSALTPATPFPSAASAADNNEAATPEAPAHVAPAAAAAPVATPAGAAAAEAAADRWVMQPAAVRRVRASGSRRERSSRSMRGRQGSSRWQAGALAGSRRDSSCREAACSIAWVRHVEGCKERVSVHRRCGQAGAYNACAMLCESKALVGLKQRMMMASSACVQCDASHSRLLPTPFALQPTLLLCFPALRLSAPPTLPPAMHFSADPLPPSAALPLSPTL